MDGHESTKLTSRFCPSCGVDNPVELGDEYCIECACPLASPEDTRHQLGEGGFTPKDFTEDFIRCPGCGTPNRVGMGDGYCFECAHPLKEPEIGPDEKVCPHCGLVNEIEYDGDICIACGGQLSMEEEEEE